MNKQIVTLLLLFGCMSSPAVRANSMLVVELDKVDRKSLRVMGPVSVSDIDWADRSAIELSRFNRPEEDVELVSSSGKSLYYATSGPDCPRWCYVDLIPWASVRQTSN